MVGLLAALPSGKTFWKRKTTMASGVKRPVWIGGRRFESMTAAAKFLGVSLGYVQQKLGGDIHGFSIRERAPRRRAASAPLTLGAVPPLLVYPEGRRPLERGIGEKIS
jgi:hypothetical protein